MTISSLSNQKKKLIVILVSFLVSIVLVVIKFYVYYKTRSASVLSDAMESIVNIVASGFASISIWIASKPPDSSHPYGHGKMEFFSAGFEGALILFASYAIMKTAFERLINPILLENIELGLIGISITVLVNITMGFLLVSYGRKYESVALKADGKHLITDAYTSIAVILGFFLVRLTGKIWIDIIVTLLIGLNIIIIGARLLKSSFRGLMQEKDPLLISSISEIFARHRSLKWIDIHELRAWRAGNELFIDFHLILPANLSLAEAHKEARRLSRILKGKFGEATHVLVQLDPCGETYCEVCDKNKQALLKDQVPIQLHWAEEDFTKPREPL